MRFFNILRKKGGIVSTAAGLLLAACVVVEDGPRPPLRPEPAPPPQACTFEYAPVCARRGGERQTFSNACMARAEGFRVIRDGECRGDGMRPPPPQQACTREYRPVCARRGPNMRTFGNACEADAAGFSIVRRGAC